jgi:selenocysteine lyase/cysteine desulfurase
MGKIIYFNDPVGLKTKQIKLDEVKGIEELLLDSVSIISTKILDASNFKVFFAQNLTTHFSDLLNVVKSKNAKINKVYITDHEVKWIADLITKKDYSPADMTHSNYGINEKIFHPPYEIEIIDFESASEIVCEIKEPAIFFFSHISRMTGQLIEAEKIFNTIKNNNLDSIIVLDGAQVLGGSVRPILKNICDVYLGVSSKFLGAEPHIGIAAISIDLFNRYYDNKYTPLEINKHQFDIYSLASNLKNELYSNSSHIDYIMTLNKKLKELLIEKNIDIVTGQSGPRD